MYFLKDCLFYSPVLQVSLPLFNIGAAKVLFKVFIFGLKRGYFDFLDTMALPDSTG